ncbi:MAG: NADPH:quinone oxidoreductase family protein [Acidimicrobiia bacterium]|nr:NADPH:quinone oxidoreductase family protein [Acidimicrobiia bacterium]
MRAWTYAEHGAPVDVLRLDPSATMPAPGPGQVALDVLACGLNFADSLLCRGTYQERPPLPATPGLEVVGRVVGDGRRVVALPALPHGGLADRCLAAVPDTFPLPDDVDDVTAAALPITYGTAWVGLFRRGGLQAGETVLVHAAAGGTGSAAVQLAVDAGARVLATAGGPDKVAHALALGAEEAWDSRAAGFDLVEAVRGVTGGRGVDIVFDPVGGDLFDASRRVVAPEGRLLVVGFAAGRVPEAPANHLLVKNYSVVGVHWGLYRTFDPGVLATAHAGMLDALRRGTVAPLVGAVRPLHEAAAAIDDLAAGRTTGKVVIRVAGAAPATSRPNRG